MVSNAGQSFLFGAHSAVLAEVSVGVQCQASLRLEHRSGLSLKGQLFKDYRCRLFIFDFSYLSYLLEFSLHRDANHQIKCFDKK